MALYTGAHGCVLISECYYYGFVEVHVLHEVFLQTRYTKGDTVTGVELQVDEPGFEAVFLGTRHHYRLDNFLRVYETQHVLKIDGILLGEVSTMKREKCY